jgi:hypothetical protein
MIRGSRGRGRSGATALAAACALAAPAAALAHLDHAPPSFNMQAPPSMGFQSGGAEGVKWDFIASFPTGNPHTDLDFFQRGGKTYASVGTLGIGPNAGGQTIFQLADGNNVDPHFVASVPTASCVSSPANATGLQHDIEATPKGPTTVLNTDVQRADRRDTQLLVDATDATGRCHDQGPELGLSGAPQGGLEIIDVTDPAKPVTIGMTSHIGQSHTVNIDPKRPHIAYSVTSDAVGIDADAKRLNEVSEPNDLDGFEVVDLSSCMNFAPGTNLEAKRQRCRPQVWRYRYDSVDVARGHTNNKSTSNGVFGCHELEIYPDDRLTCAAGNASILFDMKGAFDDNGTPTNYLDDKPRGTPLPCRARESSSASQFKTGATIMDCVQGTLNAEGQATNLGIPNWLKIGSPSLVGVKWLGSAFHQGRETTENSATPDFSSSQDIDFSHETELTNSGNFIISSDERGGGILPPGASCSPGADNPTGNGGLHAYRVDQLQTKHPDNAEQAFGAYARNSQGGKAIFRSEIRTKPQAALCTAHVFQQIPGQNRIFMGWYSQGTHVIDFTEHANGTIDFREVGHFIPENANEWTSAIWRVDRDRFGAFTYWGAAADFYVGDGGRGTVDLYKVTLPPPPTPAGQLAGTGTGFAPLGRLTIQRDQVSVRPDGTGTIRLSCLSPERCAGRLRLVTGKKVRTKSGKRAVVTVAKSSFSLAPGRRGYRLRVKLTRTGRRLAAARNGIQLRANALVRFGDSRAFAVRKTLRARSVR